MNYVVSIASRKEIEVRAWPAFKLVVACSAVQRVVSIPPEQAIISRIALERVVSHPSVQKIIATPADKLVVALLPVEPVITCVPQQQIVGGGTAHQLLIGQAGLEKLRFGEHRAIGEAVTQNRNLEALV